MNGADLNQEDNNEQNQGQELIIKVLEQELGLSRGDIDAIEPLGGMTNTNFIVVSKGNKYVFRLPGKGTEMMINRINEQQNTIQGVNLNLHPELLYCDPATGIKITRYIEGASTLNSDTARERDTIQEVAGLLRRLHNSGVELAGSFIFEREYDKYYRLLQNKEQVLRKYPKFSFLERFIPELSCRLDEMGRLIKPCHNDLVPENLIQGEDKLYLVDWEYAGMNDPAWDVASYFCESDLTGEQREWFLTNYAPGEQDSWREKILLQEISMHLLWFVWTLIKEEHGVFFGDYGTMRLNKAYGLYESYGEIYGK